MSVVNVELSIASDSFVVGSILHNHEDVRVELVQFVPIGEALIPYLWVDTQRAEAFEEAVCADERVEDLTPLDSEGTRTLYRIEWAEVLDGFLSAVADHDLVVQRARGTADRWTFRLQGPARENLSSFQESLREQSVPITVHRVWNPEVTNEDRYGLTRKQRETLELACAEGYFEVPRRTSLTDLSETLEISHQSVSRRIRGGLGNLLTATLMTESESTERPTTDDFDTR